MVVQAIHNGVVIAQRDIVYHPRVGDSKLQSFRDGWRHLRFLVLHSPTMLLLLPGAVCWVLGLLLALPMAFGPVVIGGRNIDIHFMIMAGLLNIVGVQIVTIGLLAKSYGHLSGLRHDEFVARLYRWFTFEKAFLGSATLALAGCVIAGVGGRRVGPLRFRQPEPRPGALLRAPAARRRRPARAGLVPLFHHGAAASHRHAHSRERGHRHRRPLAAAEASGG